MRKRGRQTDRQTETDRKLLIQLLVNRDDDSNKNSKGNSGCCHSYITHSIGNTSSNSNTSPDDNTILVEWIHPRKPAVWELSELMVKVYLLFVIQLVNISQEKLMLGIFVILL